MFLFETTNKEVATDVEAMERTPTDQVHAKDGNEFDFLASTLLLMKNSVLHKKTGNKKQNLNLGNLKIPQKNGGKKEKNLNKKEMNAQVYKANKDSEEKKTSSIKSRTRTL